MSHPAYLQVTVDRLQPADDNPRRDLGDIDSLAASMPTPESIVEPLIVVPEPGQEGRYRIVAGHRRHAAAIKAGLPWVPCVLRDDMDDQARREAMLVENLQRKNLDPLEEARGYQLLADSHRMSQRKIAERVGVGQPHVSKRLKLLTLPSTAHEMLADGRLTIEEAVDLAKCDDPAKLLEGADLTVPRGHFMSVQYLVRAELDAKATAAKVAKRRRELEDAGATVYDGKVGWPMDLRGVADTRPVRLHGLDRVRRVNLNTHDLEPCHAVHVGEHHESAVCTDPSRHPLREEQGEREQLRLEQQEARKDAEAASELRREIAEQIFVGLFDTGDIDPEWVLDHLLVALLAHIDVYHELPAVGRMLGQEWAASWNSTELADYAAVGREQLLRAALATVLTVTDWGRYTPDQLTPVRRAHLELLVAHGYQPTDAEQALLDGPTVDVDAA